jgi:hypothetical protein
VSGRVSPQADSKKRPRDPVAEFILTCLVLGPPIGFFTMTLLTSPVFNPMHALLEPSNWLFAYMIGFPFAFVSACLFMLITRKLYWNSFLSSIFAALVPVLASAGWALLNDYSRSHVFQWSSIEGMPKLAIVSLTAMLSCWLVARALRIVK